MNYNSGNARRNFYAKWVKLREEYQAAGMKEDAIQKMYEYDLAVFNDDRAHHRYDVEIPNAEDRQKPCQKICRTPHPRRDGAGR